LTLVARDVTSLLSQQRQRSAKKLRLLYPIKMFFKKLRSRSSNSKSVKPDITRTKSSSSSSMAVVNSKVPELVFTSEQTPDEAKDYVEFLEKARKDAERREKERLIQIKRARETTMSPWASRM